MQQSGHYNGGGFKVLLFSTLCEGSSRVNRKSLKFGGAVRGLQPVDEAL